MELEKITTKTLQKWQRQLLEMNEKGKGKFVSNINYALHMVNIELRVREKKEK